MQASHLNAKGIGHCEKRKQDHANGIGHCEKRKQDHANGIGHSEKLRQDHANGIGHCEKIFGHSPDWPAGQPRSQPTNQKPP